MVECNSSLNTIFTSLSDPTRRDILLRVSKKQLSISEIAHPYDLSFAAVAKHIAILEAAALVIKKRQGKQQLVRAVPKTIKIAQDHLSAYQKMWQSRFTALDEVLKSST